MQDTHSDLQKFINDLPIIDLITLHLLRNYYRITSGLIVGLVLTLFNLSILQSVGWVMYFWCLTALAYLHFRFKNIFIGMLFILVQGLSFYYLIEIVR